MGFFTFVPNHPNPRVPRMLVTPIIARDHPATSAEIPLNIKSAGRCKPIKVTWKPHTKIPLLIKYNYALSMRIIKCFVIHF